ncbi:MAG: glycerol-3-phosphate acyltransferase [Dehalococcoidales bacterium]|nr:glycerol-3-phosphate acyltransferase [Dehalococcoidales bacterium]
MIVNEFVSILIAFIIGYSLGSLPTAYIATRLKTGKDIRKLGGGNVGGLNTFKEVGTLPAIIVTIIDIAKGAVVVAITHWGLNLGEAYVLTAAIAAVIGHNWMVWLKFSGGKGMGASIGALLVIMPIYGYSLGLGVFLAIIVIPLLLTRNVALSMGIGLIVLPFIFWLGGTHSGMLVIWSVILALVIAGKFLPTALRALAKTTGVKDFIKGH